MRFLFLVVYASDFFGVCVLVKFFVCVCRDNFYVSLYVLYFNRGVLVLIFMCTNDFSRCSTTT
jgi:hypothetical protein